MYVHKLSPIFILLTQSRKRNIEYKLQLLNPSPARFARLVTQLKWRLLEGGGQAYYELGVADSGALIGLPRAQLEMTLETLEMMAGEIGASVIVVKEIEVPAVIAGIGMAEEGVGLATRGHDSVVVGWASDGSKRKRRADRSNALTTSEDDSNASSTTETEPKVTDTDTDDAPHLQSNNSSFDSLQPGTGAFTAHLEISSVYKPRPMRCRMQSVLGSTGKRKTKKYLLPPPHGTASRSHDDTHIADADASVETKQQAKAASRRLARDRKREEQKKALLNNEPDMDTADPKPTGEQQPRIEHDVEDLTSSLATLHASMRVAPVPTIELDGAPIAPSNGIVVVAAAPMDATVDSEIVSYTELEPRLIVEALVVRKLSLEEAFLDFGGFALAE
jgi:hypothetical protein